MRHLELSVQSHIFSQRDSRLVKNIRLQDSLPSSANILAKEWDFDIAERDAEFKDDLRAASGIGRNRKKVAILSRRLHTFIDL